MASNRVDMSVGKSMANGDHVTNGVVRNEHQRPSGVMSGNTTHTKSHDSDRLESNSLSSTKPYTNGSSTEVQDKMVADPLTLVGSLPVELVEMMSKISNEHYVSMARLISRSAQVCWTDLSDVVEKLAAEPLPAPRSDPGKPLNGVINDQSKPNQARKELLWDFAQKHKDILVKLLVLLQWSKNGEDVRKTIAINYWLHARRDAFVQATQTMALMIRDLAGSQIPNPDLLTATEVLATGKIASLPDLGYSEPPPLTARRMAKILMRLNTVLAARLALDDDIPLQLRNFRVHDGRVTFSVASEFDLDLSLTDESEDAKFGMVDISFRFSPKPLIPDYLHTELEYITNSALDKEGLAGAYSFLHDLTLSYKLAELQRQTKDLAQGRWAGHIRTEMLRRTLVVQYWVKRPLGKSWIELGVSRGRRVGPQNIPEESHLSLRWVREGKLVEHHDLFLDISELSMENLLRQVIAHHINHIFEAIYTKVNQSPLYERASLEIEQSISSSEPTACQLSIQMSKCDFIATCIEPVSGSFVLSPASERTNRLQYELTKSKNMIDDFATRLISMRCSLAESLVLKSIAHSTWQPLAGLKPSLADLKTIFGSSTVRANFFRLENWKSEWMLAVTQGAEGDNWWLAHQTPDRSPALVPQILQTAPLHLEGILSATYLERLLEHASGIIALQCNAQELTKRGLKYVLPSCPSFTTPSSMPSLAIQFGGKHSLDSVSPQLTCIRPDIELTYLGLERSSRSSILLAKAHILVSMEVLQTLASAKLDDTISIFAQKKQITLRMTAPVGQPVIDEVVSKLAQLENLASCADLAHTSTAWKLQKLSLSSISIDYHVTPTANLSLAITFPESDKQLSARFLPSPDNPHAYIAPQLSDILTTGPGSFSFKLNRLLSIVHVSLPLVSCLRRLQMNSNEDDIKLSISDEEDSSKWLRVHVISRQALRFAVHYFASSPNFEHDISDTEIPKKLLARLEIEPRPAANGRCLGWILRPAIEEYETYKRPSFAAKSLKERLDQNVFMKARAEGWLALDTAAVCLTAEPQRLLQAVHNVILAWVKESTAGSVSADVEPKMSPLSNNKTAPKGANTKLNGNVPNGQSSRIMTASPQQVRNLPNNQRSQQNSTQRNPQLVKRPEVITLD